MNIDRVSLDKEEAIWFGRYVIKMIIFMENAGKKDPTILQRTTYKTLVSLKTKAELFSASELPVNDAALNRKQKLLLRDLINGVHKNLIQTILPEYKRRGGHEKYITSGEERAEFLQALMRKFR